MVASDSPIPGLARLRPLSFAAALLLVCALVEGARAQGGEHTLWGDLKVDASQVEGPTPLSFHVVLYREDGVVVARQTVSPDGRYRFLNLRNGVYDVAVEVDNAEVARVRVQVSSPFKNDFRQDLPLEWRPRPGRAAKAGTVSSPDAYGRTRANQSLFEKADEAIRKKDYARAAALLQQVVGADPKDYQAWTELGTVYLLQENSAGAEQSYLRALKERPSFALALVNLGRLRIAQKNFDAAIESLEQAVRLEPPSAAANFYLGEAYLQVRKGSRAVNYLYEAIRLDPVGMSRAHLRLAALYNGAGLKDKAAAEYEQFLVKNPDHPERGKLERYIKEHKKP